jgi:hypothetical protein
MTLKEAIFFVPFSEKFVFTKKKVDCYYSYLWKPLDNDEIIDFF